MHVPIYTLDARSRADEAKAIVFGRFPFMNTRWRRGSVPSAAELPVTAASPSMHGHPGFGGLIIGLPSFPGALGYPS